MSTRATYQIGDGFGIATIYIHHDGYPSGAAVYFEAARELAKTYERVSFLASFLWANKKAELTAAHDAHGDTEYRYDVTRGLKGGFNLTAYKRDSFLSENFSVIFSGTVDEFIERYLESNAA